MTKYVYINITYLTQCQSSKGKSTTNHKNKYSITKLLNQTKVWDISYSKNNVTNFIWAIISNSGWYNPYSYSAAKRSQFILNWSFEKEVQSQLMITSGV